MARFGMFIDTRACVGCYACRVSCQRQNALLPTEAFIHYIDFERGEYPQVKTEVLPMQCMHCDNAPCAQACPTGATYVTEDGVVRVDQDKCIGCKYCMVVCPFNARVINEETGTVDKCRLCASAFLDGTPNCSCVSACLTGARIVGDLDDPESEISQAITRTNAQPLAGTAASPKIYYAR